ncbi:MAG: AMP-binding protein [Roseovarius sp.]
MFPGNYSDHAPDRPAVLLAGSGKVVTYAELEERSCRLATLFRNNGLQPGDRVAIFSGCHERYFEVVWAVLRCGLYLVPVNANLTVDEAAFVIGDSGARLLVASADKHEIAGELTQKLDTVERFLMFDDSCDGFELYQKAIAAHEALRPEREPLGEIMLYSSGTTGRPKGVWHPLSGRDVKEGWDGMDVQWGIPAGIDESTVCLVGGALYFGGPLIIGMWTQAYGGTVVVQERFDAEEMLAIIDRHKVTHGFFVPTMFVRLLRLPEDVRARYDISSMRCMAHAAAPCSAVIKRQMISWFGPIVEEYYTASEEHGLTWITTREWEERPGSVGRAHFGKIHVVDDAGNPLSAGELGNIYFSGGKVFDYWKDPEKTQSSRLPGGLATTGDIGYVDEAGYLYLADRKDFTVISGGINIYPKEIEDCLIAHPEVNDVVVFGVPDPDFGEAVKAIVEPARRDADPAALAEELIAFCRAHLAHFKCPKSVDLIETMPREETGKLKKRQLRDAYWAQTGSVSPVSSITGS